MGIFRNHAIHMLLAGSLMFTSGIIPAYAATPTPSDGAAAEVKEMEQAKVSKEKALDIAKKTIDIPKDFVQRNAEFQSKWWGSQTPAWIFFWDRQSPGHYGNIQIAVDANSGSVLHIEMYNPQPNQKPSYPPKVDTEQAKEIAMKYIKEKFPDKANQIVFDDRFMKNYKPPLDGYVEYPIFFKRQVNGIIVESNEIRVSINSQGDIVSMGYRWRDDWVFPTADNIISEEAAREKVEEHLNLALRLLPQWGPKPKREMMLGYLPQQNTYYQPTYLRASDGALLSMWGEEINANELKLIPISDKKLGELNTGQELTEKQALDTLKKYFTVPADATLVRSSYHERWGENEIAVWEFNWESRSQQGITTGWSMAAVEAKTGRILHFNNEKHLYMANGEEKTEPEITKEQAEQKAMDLMKKLHPDIAHQIYLQRMPKMPYEEANPIVSIQFTREVNGVSPEYPGITVNVDRVTGNITSYWFNADNMNLPNSLPNIIDKEQAKKTYLEQMDIRLAYVVPEPKPIVKAGESQTVSSGPILVYTARLKETGESIYLDATTGKWTNRETGKPLVQMNEVTDIKGHWAEKELSLLLKYNIFDVVDGKINPDEVITRGEMIKMLVLVENNGYRIWYDPERPATFKDVPKDSPYYGYIESAADRNLIPRDQENFKPDERINREELAQLVVRALGYDNLAMIKDMFNNDLKDSSSIQDVGSAVIATKLQIMDTKDGYFQPSDPVTRADAAVAFHRYLSKRSDLRPTRMY